MHMWNAFYDRIERAATWPFAGLLCIAFGLCYIGFIWRNKILGYKTLDSRFWYTPSEAFRFFNALGEDGRWLYAVTEITLDFVFPLIYGLLLAFMIIFLCDRNYARLLALLPVLTVAADMLENNTVAYLAWCFDGRASLITWAAAVFTATKWVLFSLSLGAVIVGALIMVGEKWTK